ncbi:MAG: transporter [Candidatus Kapaibacterium sp.]
MRFSWNKQFASDNSGENIRLSRVALIGAIIFLAPCFYAAAQEAEIPSISTDRPGQTMPPAILLPGSVEVEAGVQFVHDQSNGVETTTLSVPQALVRIGLLPTMELRVQGEARNVGTTVAPAATTSHSGLAGLAVGTKIGMTGESKWVPETAFGMMLAIPAGDDAYRPASVAPTLFFAMRNGLSSTLNLYYNLGESWDGTNGAGTGFYDAALWNSFSTRFSGFVEMYGSFSTTIAPTHAADIGAAFLVTPNIQLDLFGGAGITDSAPDYFVNGGISFRLPR